MQPQKGLSYCCVAVLLLVKMPAHVFAQTPCTAPAANSELRAPNSALKNSALRTPHSELKTPPFTLKREGQRWSLVSPDGKPFFSLGVCVVTPGTAKNDYDPENPSYASWRYYPDSARWADTTLRRLKDGGFTTIGAWSDDQTLRASKEMLPGFMPVLHLGSTAGAPWWDMWDEKITARMEEVARRQIVAVRDDPRLIGYYTDNEMGWWNATLFKMTLEHAPTSGQRQRLIQLLRKTYDDDWQKLLADFEPAGADGWAELERSGRLHVRAGGNGVLVMRRFLAMVAERYYQLAHDIIRKHDRRALILGDRYQSFYYPEVARVAGRHMDVVSTNLNAHWNDGTFLRCYLDTLHALTGKPILVSEFYAAAVENRSGNKNNHGVFPVVATQRSRAATAERTLAALVQLPYVVGVDWFQYFDEPRHGREDGENFNFGLVDIHDQPYEELGKVFADFSANRIQTRNTERAIGNASNSELRTPNSALKDSTLRTPHSALDGVPPAPADPLAAFAPMTALKNWDRQRGFVPPSSELPIGDLYICWSPEAIHLGLYFWDAIDEHYYANNNVPKIDRALWTVEAQVASTPLPTRGEAARGVKRESLQLPLYENKPNSELRTPNSALRPVRVRLGAGREPISSDPDVPVHNLSGTKLDVRNIAVMTLPAARLGKHKLQTGDNIDLECTLTTHGRAYRVEWKGSFQLRN